MKLAASKLPMLHLKLSRNMQRVTPRKRQKGVAIVTALLLTTLAITIVSSLFFQQDVQIRTIENQRLQLQTKWILRGALDYAQLLLREDLNPTMAGPGGNLPVDHLGEFWAIPLADTRLDDYVEKDKNSPREEGSDASLNGNILDAQSRYNLANLATHTEINADELAVYTRLLEQLKIDTKLAKLTAKAIASTQLKLKADPANPNPNPPSSEPSANSNSEPTALTYVDDLLSISGYTPEILQKLRNHVIFLPRPGNTITAINVNTASTEVLVARIPGLSPGVAANLVGKAKRGVFFRDSNNFQADVNQLMGGTPLKFPASIAVTTNFFLVNGKVKLDKSSLETQALVERSNLLPNKTKIIWIKEN